MSRFAVWRMLAIASLCGATQPAATEPLQLAQIAPGIYVHQGRHLLPDHQNRGEIANIGFILGERCVAVIDTGGSPQQGRELREVITRLTSVPICFVINTHMHPDHVYGNAAFKQPGTHFVGHYKLGSALATRAPFYRDKASRDLGFTPTADDFVFPDRDVRDTLELDLGSRLLTLTAHPTAHTDNDLTVFDHQTATLWAADLLFVDHIPVIDGSLNGWIGVLDQLKRVPAKRVVAGHGPMTSSWPEAAAPEDRYLRLLRDEIRQALQGHRTMEQAMESVGQSEHGAWALFDQFHKRNVATAFAELEWEDD